MLFPTVQFGIFFPIVLTISWGLMSRPWAWKPFILAASYVFYAAASPLFCLLLAGITLWNHTAAQVIVRTPGQRGKSVVTAIAVTGNLLALGVFKYYSFFTEAIARGLNSISLGMPLPLLTIALPVGISFFTFQAISYTVDVRRGLVKPAGLLPALGGRPDRAGARVPTAAGGAPRSRSRRGQFRALPDRHGAGQEGGDR
jgi:alginate O-acetyltransferase complex protein AlgI